MVAPPSPPARRLRPPSWLDARLIGGLLLVIASTAAGAGVLATADRSVQVWALTRDLAPGTVLAADDVRPVRVRLFESGRLYLGAAQSPAGRTVDRDLRAGELLPLGALRSRLPALVVNIPVPAQNAPSVTRGQAVDVWATVKGCAPTRILAAAAVQDVRIPGDGPLSTGVDPAQVAVRVTGAEAERLVGALGAEATIRLVVVDGAVEVRRGVPPLCPPAEAAAAQPAGSTTGGG